MDESKSETNVKKMSRVHCNSLHFLCNDGENSVCCNG
jgi:hypothetical protein